MPSVASGGIMSRVLLWLSVVLIAGTGHVQGQQDRRPPSGAQENALRDAPPLQQAIKFEPAAGVQTFAVRPPVLRLKPGAVVETRTFSRSGDYYEKDGGPWPGEVGPFLIEGATPQDTLVVRIVRLRPNRETAVSAG